MENARRKRTTLGLRVGYCTARCGQLQVETLRSLQRSGGGATARPWVASLAGESKLRCIAGSFVVAPALFQPSHRRLLSLVSLPLEASGMMSGDSDVTYLQQQLRRQKRQYAGQLVCAPMLDAAVFCGVSLQFPCDGNGADRWGMSSNKT